MYVHVCHRIIVYITHRLIRVWKPLKADTSTRLDRLETLLENLCRANHVRIPFPRPDNKVPWE